MIRLINYEIKKNFLTRAMMIIIAILIIVNGLKIYYVSKEQSPFCIFSEEYFKTAYEELYHKYKGELTDEKLEEIMSLYNTLSEKINDQTYSTEAEEDSMTYNTFSDYRLLEVCFINDIEYETGYSEYADTICKNAIDNISFYKKVGNQYEARVNYNIAKAFYKRKLSHFYNTDGFRNLFYYDFSQVIILLLVLFGCSSVFTREKETQMNVLLATSSKGHLHTFMAKLVASVIFICFICILFSIEDYLLFTVVFGDMSAIFEPVYILEGFCNTLLNVDMFSFAIISILSKILGAIVIGMICMLVSVYGNNALQVIFVNIGILVGIVGGYNVAEKNFRFVNPLMLFSTRKLYMRQEFINFFGKPVVDSLIIYIFSIFLVIVCVVCMKKRWERG